MTRIFTVLLCAVTLTLVSISLRAEPVKTEARPSSFQRQGSHRLGATRPARSSTGRRNRTTSDFSAKDGMIVVNPGPPKTIRQLWTTAKFPKDFELHLEFRAAVNADSGLFLRAPIAGARLPRGRAVQEVEEV